MRRQDEYHNEAQRFLRGIPIPQNGPTKYQPLPRSVPGQQYSNTPLSLTIDWWIDWLNDLPFHVRVASQSRSRKLDSGHLPSTQLDVVRTLESILNWEERRIRSSGLDAKAGFDSYSYFPTSKSIKIDYWLSSNSVDNRFHFNSLFVWLFYNQSLIPII